MGYFLSIEIPDHVVAQLQEFSLPDDEHIHPQRREDLHITLAYLGHIKDEKIDDLIHALHEIEIPPFEIDCLLYTSPSQRDQRGSRMASCA